MTIGERIYLFRTERGMSQETLAEEIGVSRQSVSKWETGAAFPDTEYVIKMAKSFGISTDDLLLGEALPAQETQESEDEGGMSGEEAQKRRKDEQKRCRILSIVGFILSFAVCIAGLAVSAIAAWRKSR